MDFNEYQQKLGMKLAELRRGRGLTQEGLAKLSGITGRYLSEIERGRANPSIKHLRSLSKALQMPLPQLVDEEAIGRVGKNAAKKR